MEDLNQKTTETFVALTSLNVKESEEDLRLFREAVDKRRAEMSDEVRSEMKELQRQFIEEARLEREKEAMMKG